MKYKITFYGRLRRRVLEHPLNTQSMDFLTIQTTKQTPKHLSSFLKFRQKCIHLQTWGEGWDKTCARDRNCRKSMMEKDNNQLLMCIVVYEYN